MKLDDFGMKVIGNRNLMVLCLALGVISPVLSILAAYHVFGDYSLLVSLMAALVYLFIVVVYLYLIIFIFLSWKASDKNRLTKYIREWLWLLICVLLFLMVGDIYWTTYQPALYHSSSTDCF